MFGETVRDLPWLPILVALAGVGWFVLQRPRRLQVPRLPHDEARRRAEQLLADILTEEQIRQLKTDGYLDVPSPGYPGRSYRIYRTGGPVQVREEGRSSVLLCVQPVSYLPEADVVLMHKLLIEGCEQLYLRTANVVGWRDRSWLTWLRD